MNQSSRPKVAAIPEHALGDPVTRQLPLFQPECAEAHGKSIEALRYSRMRREEIIRMFDGVIPTSIMRVRRARARRRDSIARGTYGGAGHQPTGSKLDQAWRISSQSTRGGSPTSKQRALSQFPYDIGKALIRLYSNPGDVIIDPFAGHNSRMELSVTEGRHYVGYDISASFMEFNRAISTQLELETGMNIALYESDSREMVHTPNSEGQFTITSPPYWDLEFYGEESTQLGYKKSYSDFLEGLARVAMQNHRVLEPESYCIWVVNDFRKRGQFYAFHVDVINMLIRAGFAQHDIMIVDYGSPIRAAFATQLITTRILPKQHEYAIIMQKPI